MAEEVVEETTETTETEETVVETPEWASNIEDEGVRTFVSGYKTQEDVLKAIGYEAPKVEEKDWRSDLPKELKKTADRFTSAEDAIRAIENFRKRESNVRVPGKDAKEEEVSAYLKAIGVPESPDKYEFPEIPKAELTDEIKASREAWGQRFHELKIPNETAKTLMQLVAEDVAKEQKAQIEADKEFAKAQEDALKAEWKGESFETNKTIANRAFGELANRTGLNIEDLQKIETKDGRFLMDRAEMVKIFATIGREMSEGTLGPTVTESEADTISNEIQGIRQQIEEAQSKGDSKRANNLYQKEQKLLGRLHGDSAIVGSAGRAA